MKINLNPGPLLEDFYDVCNMYWPIEFKSKDDQKSTKKLELKNQLDEVLISSPLFILHNYSAILEKLSSDGITSKLAALELFNKMCEKYPDKAYDSRVEGDDIERAIFVSVKSFLFDHCNDDDGTEDATSTISVQKAQILKEFTQACRVFQPKCLTEFVETLMNDGQVGLLKLSQNVIKDLILAIAKANFNVVIKILANPEAKFAKNSQFFEKLIGAEGQKLEILPIDKILFLTDLLMTAEAEKYQHHFEKFNTQIVFKQLENPNIQEPILQASLVYLTAVVRLGYQENDTNLKHILDNFFNLLSENQVQLRKLEGYRGIRIKILECLSFCSQNLGQNDSNYAVVAKFLASENLTFYEKSIIVCKNQFLLVNFYEKLLEIENTETVTSDLLTAFNILITSRNDPTNNFDQIHVFRGFSVCLKNFDQFVKICDQNLEISDLAATFASYIQLLSNITKISPEEANQNFLNEIVDRFLDQNENYFTKIYHFGSEDTPQKIVFLEILLVVLGAAKNLDNIKNLNILTHKLLFEVTEIGLDKNPITIVCGKILAVILNKSSQNDLKNKIVNDCKTFMQTRLFRSVPQQILHNGVFSFCVWSVRALLISGDAGFKTLFSNFYRVAVTTNCHSLGKSLKLILKKTEDQGEYVDENQESTPQLLLTKSLNSKVIPFWKQMFLSNFLEILNKFTSKTSKNIEMICVSETISNLNFETIGVSNLKLG